MRPGLLKPKCFQKFIRKCQTDNVILHQYVALAVTLSAM